MARKKINSTTPSLPPTSPRINEEEYKILSNYTTNFKQAQGGYIRGIYSKDIDILAPIYKKIGYSLGNKSCGGCIINMLKQLGKEYEIYKNMNGK